MPAALLDYVNRAASHCELLSARHPARCVTGCQLLKFTAMFLLIRVIGVMAYLAVLLSVAPLRRILDWLTPRRHRLIMDMRSFRRAARYTDALVRRLPAWAGSPCLLRSLTLYYFATRCSLGVKIHCGVRRAGSALEGHAWLSLDGKPFYERGRPDQIFSVTLTFPPAQQA